MQKLSLADAQKLAVETLCKLIETPSLSKDEESASKLIESILSEHGYSVSRTGNNVWAICKDYDPLLPTLLLNSHLDTVKPAKGYETDPFKAVIDGDKITGLGSNDAGASLVSLLATFITIDQSGLKFNRVFLASAEEEISGPNGIQLALPELGKIDAGIVGEPTQMEMAVAEKGLLVLDCEVKGKSGHAARCGGINAITEAIKEIEWFHSFQFPNESTTLGPVKMTVTMINSGTQHNVIPDTCTFVVDVRTNEHYSNEKALEIIQANTKATVTPRSLRMNSSGISSDHPLVKAAKALQINRFGSPTTSDQALITTFPTIKMGPGDSNRSHTANEYIFISEINKGIEIYIQLLRELQWD